MRGTLDVETTGLLDHHSIDYKVLPFKLKPSFKVHCAVIKDIETGEKFRYKPWEMQEFKEKLLTMTEVIGHNIINYDMRVLQMYFDLDFKVDLEGGQDTLNGKPCTFTDTLIWSRLLNPDRLGGHSLKAWGKRLGILKGDYGEEEEAWDKFSEDMLDYNEQDVEVTEATYYALMEEKGNWDWSDAYQTEKVTAYLVSISEHVGFYFNKELAEKCLVELNGWMAQIEKDVEPLLPPKKMGKTAIKDFIPPANQIKKDGSLAKAILTFADKVGGNVEEVEDGFEFRYGNKSWKLPMEREPIETMEPMYLSNQKDVKEYLVAMGWNPTEYGENDLTVDSKKLKRTAEKFHDAVKKYCLETYASPFKKHRYQHLGVNTARQMYEKLMNMGNDRPVRVLASPKFTVGQDKELCKDLERLGEQADFVGDVVKWLTYRHRRNAILSPNGTGFLSYYREDGCVGTPSNSCGAATSRFTHKVVCNIPRVSSLYGDKMRSLFGVPEGFYQVGYDFSGLEARVEGHFTMPYQDGDIYAEALLAEKPDDIHSVNAAKMGVSRDNAKTMKYAISYGAQAAKLSKQMNWTLPKAKAVFEAFWEAALPLKMLKDDVTKYWTKTGKKFIKGVDGRKLWIRSQHSILNMLFQSTGVIAAKKANIFHNIELDKRGLLFNPFKDSSWTKKAAMMIHYH